MWRLDGKVVQFQDLENGKRKMPCVTLKTSQGLHWWSSGQDSELPINAGCPGSIPGRGTKILNAAGTDGKKKTSSIRSSLGFKMVSLILVCACVKSLQLCLTPCNPMDWGLPGSSVHGSQRRRGQQKMRCLGSITNSVDLNLSTLWEIVRNREAWHLAVHEVAESQTRLSD